MASTFKLISVTFALFNILAGNVLCAGENAATMKQSLDEVFRDYDKGFRPFYGEKPTQVGVTAYVLSFESVDELNMVFTFSFYFRQTWHDPRLAFSSQWSRGRGHQLKSAIQLDEERSRKIWRPDTFFVNEKTSVTHDVTTPNEFVRLQSNGTVLVATRYTTTASCPMDLRFFPFDSQTCTLEIESFGTSMEDTVYYWAKGEESLGIAADVSLPGIAVVGHTIKTMEIALSTGNYSRLSLEIQFKRLFIYYIVKIYVPMAVLVIVSLLTFIFTNPFLEPLIHVVTISFLILQKESWMGTMAMVSYLTSISLYFLLCLSHLLLALFVSLATTYRHIREAHNREAVCIICKPLTELDDYHHRGTNDRRRSPSKPTPACTLGSVVLYVFKLLTIGSFIACNIIYWLYYRALTKTANITLIGGVNEE